MSERKITGGTWIAKSGQSQMCSGFTTIASLGLRPNLLAASKHVLMLIDAAVDGFPQSELVGLRTAIAKAEGDQA